MVAHSFAQRLTPTIALALAGGVGMFAALAALLVPGGLFENAVLTSGIAVFLPAAEPPLGVTARICLAVVAGGASAAIAWAGLSLLPGLLRLPDSRSQRGPTVRRADAHPDAPPREPLRAGRDLGFESPVDEVESPVEASDPELPPEPVIAMGTSISSAESQPAVSASFADPAAVTLLAEREIELEVQPLPADLDQPLSAFDPGAVPDAPRATPRPVMALHREPPRPVYAESERFETFDLAPTPPVAAASPISGAETVATVHSLLDRLEQGIARRGQPAERKPEPATAHLQGLGTTLEQLRRMAVRA